MRTTHYPTPRRVPMKRRRRLPWPGFPVGPFNVVSLAILPPVVAAFAVALLFASGRFGELPLNLRATRLEAHAASWPVWLAPDVMAVKRWPLSVADPPKEPWDGETVVARRLGTGFGRGDETRLLTVQNDYASQLAWAFFGGSKRDAVSPDGRWRLNLRSAEIGFPQICLYRLVTAGKPLSTRFDKIDPVMTMSLPEYSPCGFGGPPFHTLPTFAWQRDAQGWAMLIGTWDYTADTADNPYQYHYRWNLSFYRVGKSRTERVVDVSSLAPKPFDTARLIGFTEAGNPVIARRHLTTMAHSDQCQESGDLVEVGLPPDDKAARPSHRGARENVRVVKTILPALPKGVHRKEIAYGPIAVSPAGDRLVWAFHRRLRPWHLLRFLAPWVESVRPLASQWDRWAAEREVREIWTSRIDGTGMERVGWLPATEYDREPGPYGTGSIVAWSPDGRRLLFDYNGDIYALTIRR